MKSEFEASLRKANVCLASILGLVAFGFFAFFLYMGMA